MSEEHTEIITEERPTQKEIFQYSIKFYKVEDELTTHVYSIYNFDKYDIDDEKDLEKIKGRVNNECVYDITIFFDMVDPKRNEVMLKLYKYLEMIGLTPKNVRKFLCNIFDDEV